MDGQGQELKEYLLSRDNGDESRVSINTKWLSDLFHPDNIKDGVSLERLQKIKGYQGLQSALKTNRNKGTPATASDQQWRSRTYGTNDPIVKPPKTLWDLIMNTFEDDTIKILCAAAAVSLILGISMHGLAEGWLEGASILFAVIIISTVTAGNDYMKERQFRKLNEAASRKDVNVIRNDKIIHMSVYEVLVGDVIQVETGEILSVDGIVFQASKMSTDESSITGESDQVKKEDFVAGKKKCNPFLISGSKVMEGTGYMIALAVGRNSREGINKEKLQQDEDQTPLQEKLTILADQIGKMGLGSAAVMFLALFAHLVYDRISNDQCFLCLETANKVVQHFIIAVSLIVMAVPEGLPLAVTISLAYSVGKMKDENNLVRFLSACETMGGANNICSDKTGTLTKNLMTVTKLWTEGKVHENFSKEVPISRNTVEMLCNGVALNSNAQPKIDNNHRFEQIGNKTQCALLEMAYKIGYDFRTIRKSKDIKILDTVPFSSSRKRMSVIVSIDGKPYIFTKGASDFLLPHCSNFVDRNAKVQVIDQTFKNMLASNLSQFASHSLRTLLLCYRPLEKEELDHKDESLENNLIVLGLAGIKDPLKEGIPEAVTNCKRAGIVVRMVTGDNTQTATAIAKDANIIPSSFEKPGKGQAGEFIVMEGKEFRERVEGLVKAEDADKQYVKNLGEFKKIVKELRVLARSSPQDKYLLATGLKQLENVVAMTGDGTNDAPALKKADIGFAMGIAGTQVAKEAAGIILLDDNFSSIITAVKYGRNIFDCIRKFLQFQLTVNLVAIAIAILSAVFIKESPLTAVQMLWVNLIMDTLAALALATEPPSDELLYRMPYSRKQYIITPLMWRGIVLNGLFQVFILAVVIFKGPEIFGVESSIGVQIADWNHETGQHYTLFFNCFVFLQVFNFFNARKLKRDEINIFSNISNNFIFILIVIAIFVCQLFIVEFGGKVLRLVPLSMDQHLICIAIGALCLVSGVFVKKCIPESLFNSFSLFSETERQEIYDVDSELQKIWKQPATMRRSSTHRV